MNYGGNNMTREQAKQKLISFGVVEPTDEQISDLLNSINAETKKEKDRADGYKAKADTAEELQKQIDDMNSQNLSEVEKATKALEAANNRIAELEKRDAVRTQRANAMEKFGITAEQASKVVTDDGATDYDVLSQIFTGQKEAAVADVQKELLANTPNPSGLKNGGKNTAMEMAMASAKRAGAANEDVLNYYRRK